MSKSVQTNDTLLYISNVSIYVYVLNIERRKKRKKNERSQKERERETVRAREREKERASNRYHTVDCHAKTRRTITKKKTG